ncbi:MAG: L,D-transpeptidase family protein, partial [Deltaproteobacteria bacterium]|nr:L,D-transpeptidase family protein [Deltaproteobacteria bacterium]
MIIEQAKIASPSLWAVMTLALILAVVPCQSQALAKDTDAFLPDAIIDPGQDSGLIMVVNKAEQLLFIYRHDGQGNVWLEKIVPCSTGMIQGDKLVRGDKKTPEGYYIFRQKLLPYELPDIYGIVAYPMDYPNFWDRKVGRGGDGIWTHGINKPLMDYDSNGCIEIQNHDIAALENEIKLHDTPIVVYEEIVYASREDLNNEAKDIAAFLENWRLAWSSKNIPAYANFYDESLFYNTDELSYKGWIERKARVAQGYKTIQIDISNLRIFRHRDTVIATFTQDYRGDSRFRSLGHKRLYLKGQLGDWRIVAEEYGPLPGRPPEKWLTAQQKNEALNTPPLAVAQLSEPIAVASAGVILPSGPILVADNKKANNQTQAQAAADEAARAALEQRTSQNTPQTAAVTVLASLNAKKEPSVVVADSGSRVANLPQGVVPAPIAATEASSPGQPAPVATTEATSPGQPAPVA